MGSIFPIITVTELRKETKDVLADLSDYIVVQNHGKDVAMILHPSLGKVIMRSGALRKFIEKASKIRGQEKAADKAGLDLEEFDQLIGKVVLELSKK